MGVSVYIYILLLICCDIYIISLLLLPACPHYLLVGDCLVIWFCYDCPRMAQNISIYNTHMLHVFNIYLHFPQTLPKCR